MKAYTREEIDAAIQAAADVKGEPLSTAAYREFRGEQGGREARIPTIKTIAKSSNGYGSWTAACEANEVEAYSGSGEGPVTIADRVRSLRAAATELGEPLGLEAYRNWRTDADPAIGSNTHLDPRGIDGWADWCHIAGVEPKAKGLWRPLEILYALRHAADETEGILSQQRYEAWRHEQDGVYPSERVILQFWPTFTAARAIALGDRDEVPPEAWEE